MEASIIQCEARSGSGKSVSRKLRASGRVPGIVYGRGREPLSVSFSESDLQKSVAGPAGQNTLLRLQVGGSEQLALLQTYQKHPLKGELLHADFLAIDPSQPVVVKVRITETGKCKGVVDGGILSHVRRRLGVRCLPTAIPTEIVVDITELGLNESLHAGDIVLPEGVTLADPARLTIFTVTAATEEEAPVAAAPAEGEAAAAPAEGAAAAAAGGEGEKADKKAEKKE